ncbi:TadE family type IV pilus minor pilin [Actinoplanes sp. NPDC051513]|uniref:TadE family type IV pilus minor pilin n=1 Tax=Actinoplanes sp. NPDC051513 TaxID=3363908 RepID=UPI0037A254BD
MIRRRQPGRDRGSFTAELAAGLPALILLLLAGLTAVAAVTAKGQCVDAAREGALAGARGEGAPAAAARVAPPGASIDVAAGGDSVTVVVRAPVRMLGAHLPAITVEGRAVAAREPGVTR